MNHFYKLMCWVALVCSPMAQAADVAVSVQISQPGVYGRIDVGRFPQPQVVVTQPVWVNRPVVVAPALPSPVYMWVPPGHRQNWRKHCNRYGACGVPVYFVQDRWYGDHVHPSRHGWRHDDGYGHREWHKEGRDHAHGRGHGHGHGHGHDSGHGRGKSHKHDD
jgi:hypothetical protein